MESGVTNYPADETVLVSSSRWSRVGARLSERISISQPLEEDALSSRLKGTHFPHILPIEYFKQLQERQIEVQSSRRSEKVCGFSIQYLWINTNCFYTTITKKNDATCETKDIPLGLNHSLSET